MKTLSALLLFMLCQTALAAETIVKPGVAGRPALADKMYLITSGGETVPAVVTYTTDGNGNLIPVGSGGGGGDATAANQVTGNGSLAAINTNLSDVFDTGNVHEGGIGDTIWAGTCRSTLGFQALHVAAFNTFAPSGCDSGFTNMTINWYQDAACTVVVPGSPDTLDNNPAPPGPGQAVSSNETWRIKGPYYQMTASGQGGCDNATIYPTLKVRSHPSMSDDITNDLLTLGNVSTAAINSAHPGDVVDAGNTLNSGGGDVAFTGTIRSTIGYQEIQVSASGTDVDWTATINYYADLAGTILLPGSDAISASSGNAYSDEKAFRPKGAYYNIAIPSCGGCDGAVYLNTVLKVISSSPDAVVSLVELSAKFSALGQNTMANSTPVVLASDQSAIPVTGTFFQATQPVSGTFFQATQPVSGPLTDVELRATAVPVSGAFFQATQPVSGPLTDTQLRATSVPVSGPVTDAQIRATALPVSGTFFQATQPVSGTFFQATQPVSGPLTDTELRATAVPVSGPLTDTQLRATAVPVSGSFFQATQPVSLTTLPSLAAGTNNIGDVDVLTMPVRSHTTDSFKMGDGTDFLDITAAGEAEVTLMTALPAGANNIGDVDVLTQPARAHTTDSIRIGDGTDLADVTAAGELEITLITSLPAGTNNIGDVDVLTQPARSQAVDSISLGKFSRADTYTATGNGTAVDATAAPVKAFSVQVVGTGAAATIWDVRVECSLDGVVFDQSTGGIVVQNTNTDGDGSIKWSAGDKPCRYFRSRTAALTLGAATNIVVTILGVQ